MEIHNYFNDISKSIATILDTYILTTKRNKITYYEYSIGNKTFQLDSKYNTTFKYPTCVISLNDNQPMFSERPVVAQHFSIENKNRIPVLYSEKQKKILYLQEDHEVINFSLSIACETQLHAKDIEWHIRRWLPVDKHINICRFTSFYELDLEYINKCTFYPSDEQIDNLFIKMNPLTGDSEYCFGVNYNPLYKLNSATTSISDSRQEFFVVNVDLSVFIQMPEFLILENDVSTIERISIDYTRFGYDYIVTRPITHIFTNDAKLTDSVQNIKVIKCDDLKPEYNYHNPNTVPNLECLVDLSENSIVVDYDDGEIQVIEKTSAEKNGLNSRLLNLICIISIIVRDNDYHIFTLDGYVYITIHVDKSFIIFKSYFIYKILIFGKSDKDRYKTYSKIINPDSDFENIDLDVDNNSITIKIPEDEYNNIYKPEDDNPLIIQVYTKDESDSSDCEYNVSLSKPKL